MPIYEFICPTCKNESTYQWSIETYSTLTEDGGFVQCDACQKPMRRKFSPPGIQIN